MMNMRKKRKSPVRSRTIALLCAAAVITSFVPASAFAQDDLVFLIPEGDFLSGFDVSYDIQPADLNASFDAVLFAASPMPDSVPDPDTLSLSNASDPASVPDSGTDLLPAADSELIPASVADLSVKADPVVDLSVTADPVADLSVTADPVVDLSVTADPVVDLSVTADPVVDLSVTADPVVDLSVKADPVAPTADLSDAAAPVPASAPETDVTPLTDSSPVSDSIADLTSASDLSDASASAAGATPEIAPALSTDAADAAASAADSTPDTESVLPFNSVIVDTVEEYDQLDHKPTSPETVLTSDTTETVEEGTTIDVEIGEPTTEVIEHEDGSKTVITTTPETITTTTDSTTTNTKTYEVSSEGSYTTDSKDVADYIAEKENENQKKIKEDVESQKKGEYNYSVEVNENSEKEEKSEEFDNIEEAEARIIELSGDEKNVDIEIKPLKTDEERRADLDALAQTAEALGGTVNEEATIIEKNSSSIEAKFDSPERAQAFVNAAVEKFGADKVSASEIEAKELPLKGEPKGDEDQGYTIESSVTEIGWDYEVTINITITGAGKEEIVIDFGISDYVAQPGDRFYYVINIKNETEDEYGFEYKRETEGPYKRISKSKYEANPEKYGEYVFEDEERNIVYFKPNSVDAITNYGGATIDTAEFLLDYVEENNIRDFNYMRPWEKEDLAYQVLQDDPDYLLNFYNKKMGTSYTDLYEAFRANMWNRAFTEKYGDVSPEKYFEPYQDKTLSDVVEKGKTTTITGYSILGGLTYDNLYQSTSWYWTEQIILKAIHDYEYSVKAEIDDIDYGVKYNEVLNSYEVNVKGLGSYTVTEINHGQDVIIREDYRETRVEIPPEKPDEPENPDKPDEPENPDEPETPERPEPPTPFVPVIPDVPVVPGIPVPPAPQNAALVIEDYMTPLAGGMNMNEGDCFD